MKFAFTIRVLNVFAKSSHTLTVLTSLAFSIATFTTVGCVSNVMAHAQENHISSLRTNEQVHLNRHWASVQSNAGRRGVRISGSNAGYTMFRGNVKCTGCPMHSKISPSLPFTCVTVCHQISTLVYCSLVILVLHMQSVFIQPVKLAALCGSNSARYRKCQYQQQHQ